MTTLHLGADYTTRTWLAAAAFMMAMIVVVAPAHVLDSRALWEVSVWDKPLKFCLALLLHFVTLAVLAQQIPQEQRSGLLMTGVVRLSVAAGLFEIIYIAVQASRGRHSHFNNDTAIEANLYIAMGVGAVLLVVASFALGVFLMRQRDGDRSGFRLGSVIGLIAGSILTLIVAGYMSSINNSHWVGAASSDAGGVLLFGWSRDVGDLRPSHFLATHMIQILPIIGVAADKLAPALARGVVVIAALALAVLAAALFLQALAGAPFWPR